MSVRDNPRATPASSHETPSGSTAHHALVLLPYTLGYRDSNGKYILPPEKSIQSQTPHRETHRAITVPILWETLTRRRYLLSILRRK